MIAVAIAALSFCFGRFFGERLFFGLLPVISLLVSRGFRALKVPARFGSRRLAIAGQTDSWILIR